MSSSVRGTVLALAVLLLSGAVCVQAQQNFPLKAGEWAAATTQPGAGGGKTSLFCMNNQTWIHALNQNPSCTIGKLAMSPTGFSYSLQCTGKPATKGTVTTTYDGTTHMVSTSNLKTTLNGKTGTTTSTTDWRWKSSTCSAADVNANQGAPPANRPRAQGAKPPQ